MDPITSGVSIAILSMHQLHSSSGWSDRMIGCPGGVGGTGGVTLW